MAEMTPERIKTFLDSKGTVCPFCGSEDIETVAGFFRGVRCSGIVRCHSCNEEWLAVYNLVGTETVKIVRKSIDKYLQP